MKILLTAILMAMLATAGCKSEEKPGPEPLMKKVGTAGKGLPVAKTAEPEKVKVRASMGKGHPGRAPDDATHRQVMQKGMPPGHPGSGHGSDMVAGDVDDHPVPLKKKGLGSADELAGALKRIEGNEQKKQFETGFRLTFSADRSKRDIEGARKAFHEVLKAQPGAAEAYRGLAYVALSDGFNMKECEKHYLRALELKPDYGVVHYALAFFYLGSDQSKGSEHLKKALELKIPDEQGLQKAYSSKGLL